MVFPIFRNATVLKFYFFLNQNTGYIAADSGIILKTTNTGINWLRLQSCFNSFSYQNAIFFVDSTIGFLGGIDGIGKTTNGGQNWSIILKNIHNVFTLFFINKDTGFAGGKYALFKKTTNGGIDWFDMNPQTTDYIQSITFTDNFTGYAVGVQVILGR